MDKKSIIVMLPLFVLVIAAAYNYHRIVIKKDYIISAAISCDPEAEDCYKNKCVLEKSEDCLGTLEYYKVIKKRAYNIPDCYNNKETTIEECPPLVCFDGERDCRIEYCEDVETSDCEVDF